MSWNLLLQSTEEGVKLANEIGFPVMIKVNYFVLMVQITLILT